MRISVRLSCGIASIAAVCALAAPSGVRGQTLLALGETAYLDFSGTMPGAAYTAPGADAVYIHVSIDERELSVMRGSTVLHRFPVSVGKGAYLRHRDAENGGWQFETPAGLFSVGRMEEDPVWYAPDWHFIEKGRPIPPANSPLRYFPGDMGEYALYLGDGLAIHGTRDQSSVGRAVSHGCMRLSKVGIATVYPLVKVGTKVIITS